MNLTTKLIAAGILGILTLISGVAVTKAGRPLNPIFFNLHKMIAVVMIVLIVISVVQLYKAGETQNAIVVGLTALAGLLLLGLVATGGMLSFEKVWPSFVLGIHKLVPLLALGFSALTIFLMFRSNA
jgi:hypothetical protein